jgi:hypothetical protein
MKIALNIIRFPSAAPVKPLDLVPAPAIQPVDPGVLAAAESKTSAAAAPVSGFQTPHYLTEADLALLPPLKRTTLGMAALNSLTHFIPPDQWKVTRDMIRSSEEKDFFISAILRLAAFVEAMPQTYQNKDSDPYVWLHYFGGGYDSWLIEKDKGDKDDPVKGVQHEAFGYVRWEHMPECAEVGYVSLPEAFQHMRFLNLDYHFTPCRLSELKARLDGGQAEEEVA